ncbi:hypothetical protein [Kitasatospora sp. KL5]|uniref:hypothetical protein n=1 Tax=Kitasatospora sp. KL5 TaxID=3425125 RepID=UPI003D6DED35
MEGIVRIDCAGLSLEAVVAEAWRLVGEADGAEQVLLERVGAAGPLVRSTGEPARVRQWARYHAREALGVPVVVGETAAAAARPVDLPAEHAGWLAAAAALETFRAPVPVWRAFAGALGAGPVTSEALEEFAEREPLLVLDADGVGFTGAEEHREVRRRFPLSADQQRAVHRAVLGLRGEPAAAGYLHTVWPVHAALAGELGEWIADPGFLVESEWYGLGLGLASAHPEGVPLGTVAGDLHCLLLEGLAAPASHEEWLSWVHHALVSRGLGKAAEEVAARVRLPWRTAWSRWQWPSGLAPLTDPIPLADEVHLVEREEGGVAFAIRREDEDDWDVEHEWLWDVETGEFLGGPDEDLLEEVEEDDGTGRAVRWVNGAWSSFDPAERTELARRLPWVPGAVDEAVQCTPSGASGGTLWVFSGRCGLFGALVDEERLAGLPSVPHGRPGYSVAGRAVWPNPPLPLSGTVSREELEQDRAFGPGACRPLPDGLVPAGIGNDGARAFLTGVGWPLTEGTSGLRTVDPAAEGFRPVDGRPDLWEGLGSFHGAPILLDVRTGEVRHGHRPREGEEFPLMAGSLDRLLRIVLLHHAALTAPALLGHYDGDDLERAVSSWVATVDPAAAGGGFWAERCFVPSLYDLWTDRNSE